MPRDVAAVLRKVSALRALCLRLPHLTTPAERKLLRRFDALVVSPSAATDADTEALVAGWRQWWREGRTDALCAMADRLPAGTTERDRDLAAYLGAARSRVSAPGRRYTG